jgi:hypothetical protein
MIDKTLVIGWFTEQEEDLYDFELEYLSVGEFIQMPSIPDGYIVKVIATKTDRNYDSYGNSYLEDGYIVFSVTAPDGTYEDFKLPMSYASFEGWTYDVHNVDRTVQQSKVITTWEWV